jgi:hypothetical protein
MQLNLSLRKQKRFNKKKKKRRQWSGRLQGGIGVSHKICFTRAVTWWVGTWIDSHLTLIESCRRRIKQENSAENHLRGLVHPYGVPPRSTQTIQLAFTQSTLFYGSELTWSGQEPKAKDYQPVISRMARAITG